MSPMLITCSSSAVKALRATGPGRRVGTCITLAVKLAEVLPAHFEGGAFGGTMRGLPTVPVSDRVDHVV